MLSLLFTVTILLLIFNGLASGGSNGRAMSCSRTLRKNFPNFVGVEEVSGGVGLWRFCSERKDATGEEAPGWRKLTRRSPPAATADRFRRCQIYLWLIVAVYLINA